MPNGHRKGEEKGWDAEQEIVRERERECASESKDVHWNLTLRMSVVFLIKINKVYSGFYVRRLWRRLLCSLLALDLNNHPHPPPHPHFG